MPSMMYFNQSTEQQEEDLCLLKERLRRMDMAKLAYLKGASKALLYAQDNRQVVPGEEEEENVF